MVVYVKAGIEGQLYVGRVLNLVVQAYNSNDGGATRSPAIGTATYSIDGVVVGSTQTVAFGAIAIQASKIYWTATLGTHSLVTDFSGNDGTAQEIISFTIIESLPVPDLMPFLLVFTTVGMGIAFYYLWKAR